MTAPQRSALTVTPAPSGRLSAARVPDVTRYDEIMALLERGATVQELADAAAVLARPRPLEERQGSLF